MAAVPTTFKKIASKPTDYAILQHGKDEMAAGKLRSATLNLPTLASLAMLLEHPITNRLAEREEEYLNTVMRLDHTRHMNPVEREGFWKRMKLLNSALAAHATSCTESKRESDSISRLASLVSLIRHSNDEFNLMLKLSDKLGCQDSTTTFNLPSLDSFATMPALPSEMNHREDEYLKSVIHLGQTGRTDPRARDEFWDRMKLMKIPAKTNRDSESLLKLRHLMRELIVGCDPELRESMIQLCEPAQVDSSLMAIKLTKLTESMPSLAVLKKELDEMGSMTHDQLAAWFIREIEYFDRMVEYNTAQPLSETLVRDLRARLQIHRNAHPLNSKADTWLNGIGQSLFKMKLVN